jgi:hypothetical protein
MNRNGIVLAGLAALFMQQPVQAQKLDSLLSLGNMASAALAGKIPGSDRAARSTSNSPDDPVFGQARFKARAHPQYPNAEWPDKIIEGYIARDRYGCPAFFANGKSMFVYSFDKFEEQVDGAWVALDIKKLGREVPQHCTL